MSAADTPAPAEPRKEQPNFEIPFKCRECGAKDLLAEIVIDTPSSRGYIGLPADSYPGEGCEWHTAADVSCDECGAVHDDKWMETNLDAAVCERESEPSEPYDDY